MTQHNHPIEIRPVLGRKERDLFLTFPWRILKGDPCWVPPLLPDLAERIDPKRGPFFQRGVAEFFIAWLDGKPVGTICASEDQANNQVQNVKECIFGFFHFINDRVVYDALLGGVTAWARNRGLDTLVGPFNLDLEDGYGVLIEGRYRPAPLMCGHTPPYYFDFYESSGFSPARGDNIAFELDITRDTPAFIDLRRMAERVRLRKTITIRPADLKHWPDEIDRVYNLMNRALAHLPDFRPWRRDMVEADLAPFRTLSDPELILFAEKGGETVGWLPGLPNLNEALIHANGLRYPWNYLSLFWYMRKKKECLTVKSVLIPPEHWGSGVAILLFDEMLKRAQARGYQWMDFSLTSADNPRTPQLGERFGARIYKRYRVYKKRILV
jgi:GNAT superfamily N-acetyltransferase